MRDYALITLFYIFLFNNLSFIACEKSSDHLKVTCGSAIKLTHKESGIKLHSHEVKYGSGSGQQSITGYPNADDPNSYFVVQASHSIVCDRGQPIECGSKIRLFHLNTGAYLHSHLHKSPLSGNQEVSGYTEGNEGDDWVVVCAEPKAKHWMRDANIRLTHGETEKYLFASKKYVYGNPIPGQLEISGTAKKSDSTLWSAQEGIYFSDNPIMS